MSACYRHVYRTDPIKGFLDRWLVYVYRNKSSNSQVNMVLRLEVTRPSRIRIDMILCSYGFNLTWGEIPQKTYERVFIDTWTCVIEFPKFYTTFPYIFPKASQHRQHSKHLYNITKLITNHYYHRIFKYDGSNALK